MRAERTIAIIGDTGEFCPALVKNLAGQNMRLLFVSNNEEKNKQIMNFMKPKESAAEIEIINCEKEGCWEADVIAFSHPKKIEPQLIKRIKDVATQKIVLVVSEFDKKETSSKLYDLEEFLPHSRVVNLGMNAKEKKVIISTKDDDVREIVEEFFKNTGYNINNKN